VPVTLESAGHLGASKVPVTLVEFFHLLFARKTGR